MPIPEELYLDHLVRLTGKDGEFKRITEKNVTPPIFTSFYRDYPANEYLTTFTIGLSSIDFHEWTRARPELVICVKSNDVSWGLAIGVIAEQARGKYGFHLGETINFNSQISPESDMSAFFLFYPSIWKSVQYELETPNYMVTLLQMYPIYAGEMEMIRNNDFRTFIDKAIDYDLTDVQRPDLSK